MRGNVAVGLGDEDSRDNAERFKPIDRVGVRRRREGLVHSGPVEWEREAAQRPDCSFQKPSGVRKGRLG